MSNEESRELAEMVCEIIDRTTKMKERNRQLALLKRRLRRKGFDLDVRFGVQVNLLPVESKPKKLTDKDFLKSVGIESFRL